ncbi:phosphoserine phosphatase SerB [Nisaea acidiphila]|uniref:Phosphoserine phosphatase n=1 Tax=Nisaea acidiphila TaxID=1862145 RepID=A0A9J7ARI0_9PROT|nr:phosphoserine phosphatase SerB [Nisaea acidiphila]UUX49482.1 phosphoserine phosphatase SerB [Nisaea acidiphila]
MQYVLTLTSDPTAPALGSAVIARATETLEAAGLSVEHTDWLDPETAVDLYFSGPVPEALERSLHEALAGIAADINLQAAAGRRKRLLIADMDSTVITSESLDDLAAYAGIGDKIAPITARAMRGEIDFEGALKERVAMLAGHPASLLDRLLAEVEITPGARELVATMRRDGAYTALVSGGFTSLTAPVRERLGFHTDRANTLHVADGAFTGTVGEPILGRDAKLVALNGFCAELGIDAADAVTVGDGANDLAMLQAAGTGVAFRGKPAVREAARFRVDHGDLSALLHLQGYKRSDFAL